MAQDEDAGLVLTNIQMVATVLCRNLKNVRDEMGGRKHVYTAEDIYRVKRALDLKKNSDKKPSNILERREKHMERERKMQDTILQRQRQARDDRVDAARNRVVVQCVVCMDDCDSNSAAVCSADTHHMCGTCLTDGARTVISEPPKMRNGGVPCTACSFADRSFYPFAKVAKLVTEEVVDELMKVREGFANAAGQVEERQRPRPSPLDEALTNLLNNICCPLCNTPASNAFFTNTFRLECASLGCACGAAFCGICGEDCTDGGGGTKPNDAHYHCHSVCPYNLNEVQYGNVTRSVFVPAATLLRGRRMVYIERLNQLKGEMELSSQEIIDAGIRLGRIGDHPLDITAADIN